MMKRLVLITALACSLQGCIFVAGAAAGAAGIAMVYDHRKVESVLQDQKIENAIVAKLKSDPNLYGENTHVTVNCFNNVVLLSGEVTSPELRQKAEALARSVPDISKIYNQITLQGPTSSLTHASDSWITAKIKSQMLATKDLKSGSIRVVTENGTVYLMGRVSHNQAEIAVDIAREVSGVQKVIKILQYTD